MTRISRSLLVLGLWIHQWVEGQRFSVSPFGSPWICSVKVQENDTFHLELQKIHKNFKRRWEFSDPKIEKQDKKAVRDQEQTLNCKKKQHGVQENTTPASSNRRQGGSYCLSKFNFKIFKLKFQLKKLIDNILFKFNYIDLNNYFCEIDTKI